MPGGPVQHWRRHVYLLAFAERKGGQDIDCEEHHISLRSRAGNAILAPRPVNCRNGIRGGAASLCGLPWRLALRGVTAALDSCTGAISLADC